MSTKTTCEPEKLELTADETRIPEGILPTIRRVRGFVGERKSVKVDMIFPGGSYSVDPVLSWYTSNRGITPVNVFSQLLRDEGLVVSPSYDSKKPKVISLDIRRAA